MAYQPLKSDKRPETKSGYGYESQGLIEEIHTLLTTKLRDRSQSLIALSLNRVAMDRGLDAERELHLGGSLLTVCLTKCSLFVFEFGKFSLYRVNEMLAQCPRDSG